MTPDDPEIKRALVLVADSAPLPPSFDQLNNRPPQSPEHGRPGLVLLAAAAIVVLIAVTALVLSSRTSETDIVNVPTPTAAPTPTPTVEVEAEAAPPSIAGAHPEFARMLANDTAPSTTGSGLDDIPCGEDPPPATNPSGATPDHVVAIEHHRNDECTRVVFVIGTGADTAPQPLDAWSSTIDDPDPSSRFIVPQGPPVLWAPETWTVVAGTDLLHNDGIVAAVTQVGTALFLHVPGCCLYEYWDSPARLVFEIPADRTEPLERAVDVGDVILDPWGERVPGTPRWAHHGEAIRFRFLEPGTEPGVAVLRTAPSAGAEPGTGSLIEADWARYPGVGGFDPPSACGVQIEPPADTAVERTARYVYATEPNGIRVDEFSILGLAPGDYELMFEGPDGSSGTFVEFEIRPCQRLVISEDTAQVFEGDRALSAEVRLGDDIYTVINALSAAGLDAGPQPSEACDGLMTAGTGLPDSLIVAEDFVVVAFRGVTAEGIGTGSLDTQVLDIYGAEIRQDTEEYTGLLETFEAGPYIGSFYNYFEPRANRVHAMWNGDPGRVGIDCRDD